MCLCFFVAGIYLRKNSQRRLDFPHLHHIAYKFSKKLVHELWGMGLAVAKSNSFESISLESGPENKRLIGQREDLPTRPISESGSKYVLGPTGPLALLVLTEPLGGREDER